MPSLSVDTFDPKESEKHVDKFSSVQARHLSERSSLKWGTPSLRRDTHAPTQGNPTIAITSEKILGADTWPQLSYRQSDSKLQSPSQNEFAGEGATTLSQTKSSQVAGVRTQFSPFPSNKIQQEQISRREKTVCQACRRRKVKVCEFCSLLLCN